MLWPKKLAAYAELMRLHRPIGSLLLLWPSLWALWIAGNGRPPLKILLIFIAGVWVMRSAGCVINDIADRHFDGFIERTKQRPLVTGRVSLTEALVLFGLLILLAFGLVLQLNPLTRSLAIIGLLLAVIYPFMKRFTYWPQLVLGMAFAWAVPMAFAATINQLPNITWGLYLISVLWPLAYDTQYAMTDRADDLQVGIKSTAILFGAWDNVIIVCIQAVVLLLLVAIGVVLQLQAVFFAALLIAAVLFYYQHRLTKHRIPKQCFKAFVNNQWVGLVICLGLLANYHL